MGIAEDEQLFQAMEGFDRGCRHILRQGYDKAIEAFGSAIADYGRVVALTPDDATYYNRGYAYYLKGIMQKATEDFRKGCAMGVQQGRRALEKILK